MAGSDVNVQLVETWGEFVSLRPGWDSLLERSRSDSLFLSWPWIEAWRDVVGDAVQPFVLVARDSTGRLLGLAPFYVAFYRFLGIVTCRGLRILGDHHSGAEYGDWIVDAEREAEVGAALAAALAARRDRWDFVWMPNVAAFAGARDRLTSSWRRSGLDVHERSMEFSAVALPSQYETFWRALSPNARSSLQRQARKIDQLGFSFEQCTDAGQIADFLEALDLLNHRRWSAEGQSGTFRRKPQELAFYRRFTREALSRGWLRLAALKLGAEFKAIQIGYAYRGSFLQLQEGFDPDGPPGLGNALRCRVIASCIREGITTYDFLGQHTEHKRRWQAEVRAGCDLLVTHGRPLSVALRRAGVWPTGRFLKLRPLLPRPKPSADPRPTLILGRGVTALGVLRALARSGVPAHVVGAAGNFITSSRYHRLHPAANGDEWPESDLPTLLERIVDRPTVLVPCSDSWLTAVSRLDKGLAQAFPSSVAAASTVEALVDKARFRETLEGLSLPHPITIPIDSPDDIALVADEVLADGFLKPRDSQSFAQAYGVKAFRFCDRRSAEVACRRALADGHRLVLQAYVPGPATNHYFIDGFVDRHGRVCALFARRRLRMEPPDFGNSTCMVSVPLHEAGEAVGHLRRLLKHLEYRGIFSVELKRHEKTGRLEFLEVNARAWWYIEFAAQCGVDVGMMAYRDALGESVEEVTSYATGRRCVYFHHDRRAARRLVRSGELRVRDWLASLWEAEHPIFAWDDPWPAFAESYRILNSWLVRQGRAWR